MTYFEPSGEALANLSYDGLSRLLGAEGPWGGSNYRYDEIGNFTYVGLSGGSQTSGHTISGRSETYRYDANNRLTSTLSIRKGEREVLYDANGNIRQHGDPQYGGPSYRFDGMNRLILSERENLVQRNLYDGHDRRVRTVVEQPVNGQTHRTTTYFVYSRSGELLHEYDRESGEQRDHIRLAGKTIAVVGRHQNHDSDGDGMPDHFEKLHGLKTLDGTDARKDLDGDGLSNRSEYQAGTSPTLVDSDHDGVSDFEDTDVDLPAYARRTVLDPIFSYLGGN